MRSTFLFGVGGSGSRSLKIIRTSLHVCIKSNQNLLQLETGWGVQNISRSRSPTQPSDPFTPSRHETFFGCSRTDKTTKSHTLKRDRLHTLKKGQTEQTEHPKRGLYKMDTFDTFGRPGHPHPFRKFHTERGVNPALGESKKNLFTDGVSPVEKRTGN